MMFTTGEETVIAQQPPMPHDQIVIKQIPRTAAKLGRRSDFEFQLNPRDQPESSSLNSCKAFA